MKKILLSLAVIAIVGVGAIGATKAFFSSTANATGNVFTAGTLNLRIAKDSAGTPINGWETSQNASWNFSNMAPGGTPSVSSVWLKNTGSIDGSSLGITAANTESHGGFEKQARITELSLGGSNLLTGGAGATIGAYIAPTTCDVTVSGTKLSDATTNSANNGKVVCVAPGNYNSAWEIVPTISVTYPMTIVSTGGPSVTSTEPFDVIASNVTIKGFSITGPASPMGVSIHGGVSNVSVKDNNIHDIATSLITENYQGIYLEGAASSSTSNFTFTGNTISNIGNSSNAKSNQAIYIGDTLHNGPISNVTVSNNIISNVLSLKGAYGFEVNEKGGVSSLVVKNNTISNLHGGWSTAIGLEGNTPSASVTLNDIHDLTGASTGVRVEPLNTSAASITINQNNFTPNVMLGVNNTTGVDVNGQNNWWGDLIPADQISANVNTFGFLSGPVAGLINGTDQNGNGYADMQDLQITGLSNIGVSLSAGAEKKLTMGVQLDGPTTGDAFQSASLTTNLTVKLTQ